ncbi:hypothetical protein KIW84_015511 [Lathyrus oleraceus]|uniref:Uncharacterized protein n=1 Tax=Pisum sativum TaxID=3888 RepID=A0A9D5H0R8_PEA|nr:hypothetical protein KIW84_015511 [Pisum sativum]
MWVVCFCLYLGVGLELSWRNKVIFYSFLNVNEVAGSPLCVTLLRNFNLRNVVHIDEKYKVSLESFKNHLYGRLIMSKGVPPLKLQDLCGFVDCLKITFDDDVVSIDVLHQGDLSVQGNENLCGLADIEVTDQGKIDKNNEGDSDSVDTFFQEDHQEEVIADSLILEGDSIVVADYNLLNFIAFVIHDIQVLGFVSTEAQQAMNFLSESWSNMAKKDEMVDLDENRNQPIQLVV